MTYEELTKVNRKLKKTNIKGKNYVDVSQRLQAFRSLYPNGNIKKEMIQFDGEKGYCLIQVTVFDEEGHELGSDFAYEERSSSMINKTSFVENCSTSATGRALGTLGIGSTENIASVEEMANALEAQEVIRQTEKVIDSIIELAGGDRERVNTYVGNVFPGNRLEDLDYETLVRLKKDIAKKMASSQPETGTNFNINIQRRS